jgi:hypothetical protein
LLFRSIAGKLLLHRRFDGDRIAQRHRANEAHGLIDQDGARAGYLRPEDGGDQRGAPHAVRDDLAEHAAMRVVRIDHRRIDVSGHDGEQLDVFLMQGTGERRRVTDVDLIERATLKKALFSICTHRMAPKRLV